MKVTVFLLLISLLEFAYSSRILVVFNVPARSHFILANALARGLAKAGHDVTLVSPYEDKDQSKNGRYRTVLLTGFTNEKNRPKIMNNLLDMEKINPFAFILLTTHFGYESTKNTLNHTNFQKLLKSNEHFDAVIIEQMSNDALKGLAHYYKAPLIMFSTIGANAWVNPLVGNPSPPSYISEALLSFTSNMTFWQRLYNWVFATVSELNRHLIFFPSQNKLMHEYFPDAPHLDEFLYNASIVLLNSHESVNQPVPYVPNMINVGGYHVNPPKELPKDLKDFLDNAKEGVVYFSMGSNIKPSQMPKSHVQAILGAFSKIKQKVLWKWDDDTIEGKPDNVKLGKWFPQADILAHPNTQLFITHGGLLSTTETIYHGVPILVFPIFADQKLNAANAVMGEYGLSLQFSQLTEEKIVAALDELLKDQKYRKNAKLRSRLMQDRPVKPMDLAIYWIEYVIRNRGAPHLRVAGVDLPWYKYLLLDVIAFVVLSSFSVLFVVYVVIKKLCCRKTKNKEKVKRS